MYFIRQVISGLKALVTHLTQAQRVISLARTCIHIYLFYGTYVSFSYLQDEIHKVLISTEGR